MNEIPLIDEGNFEKIVLKSNRTVLVEFGSKWCKPCDQAESILRKVILDNWNEQIQFIKINVDECVHLSMRYDVLSIPTVLLFICGEIKERFVGLQSYNQFKDKISSHL